MKHQVIRCASSAEGGEPKQLCRYNPEVVAKGPGREGRVGGVAIGALWSEPERLSWLLLGFESSHFPSYL
jgi:hypothetical protein